jgi:ABC-type branched-subunit amino acid transport system substrate-binding protein
VYKKNVGTRTAVGLARAATVALVLASSLLVASCGGSVLDPAQVRAAHLRAESGRPAGGSTKATTSSDPTSARVPQPRPDPSPVTSGQSGEEKAPGGHRGRSAAVATVASCAGFHDQTGITDSTITLANASDVTGPVPGIFLSAQQATRAFAAYFNATSRLCGRTLQVLRLDTRTDAGGDQQAYATACAQAFAAVGSMSAFDEGGAAEAEGCGLPDIRSQSVSEARNACSTCFGAQATQLHALQNAVPDYLLAHHPSAAERAAMIYVNAPASVGTAKDMMAVEEKRGMHFVYSSAFDVAEFNYTPYAQAMKSKDVGLVQFVGSSDEAVRLARAMQSAAFRPEAYVLDPTAYDRTFLAAGDAVREALVFIDFVPFEEAASNPEMQRYERWLQQVSPGASPSYFGLFAWSAARLFVEEAQSLGGRLTRASLVERLRKVDGWTDHGLHGPQAVGPKRNSSCWRFLAVRDGAWVPAPGSPGYLCHGSTVLG